MRIAIDLLAVRSWGMKNYTSGLLPEMGALAPSTEFLVFLRPDIARLVEGTLPANVRVREVKVGLASRLLWEQTVLPLVLLRWRADVLFAAFDLAPLLAPCPILLAIRNPSPATIQDHTVPKTLANRVTGNVHRWLSYCSCLRSRLVFYPTEFAADLLGSVMSVPKAKRRVVHHGTDRTYFTVRRDPADVFRTLGLETRKYVLYVSGFYYYKHPEVLVDAFETFAREPANAGFKLVLVGADLLVANAKRTAEDKLRQQVARLGLTDRVVFAGQVPREQLAALYQNAAAFVLPTVMETFGLVFVEAMASGAPVICADMPFAREICGDAARYFPPGDAAAAAEWLQRVVHDRAEVEQMSTAGRRRSGDFSWRLEAEGTLALLTEMVRREGAR